ncbi:hypothetical protein DN752_20630 [Echinicola strongylocentroti]|uniref:Uncharacterized protein n=1 Tax=Echinicola strongylocentroti TaxID=1795355 RepID=A0A2Z4IML6_9BACT|nr:hypothetical protein [Echinicola strongylocentroti]AWW32352.1 hypothetical protein DN752_20630 [Echinicola strongylocentroti]
MVHSFYEKPESQQKKLIFFVALAVSILFVGTLLIAFITEVYWISLITAPFIMIAAPFIDTPMGKKKGKLIYYSPMFITERQENHKIIFHGGTLFDYCFALDFSLPGPQRTREILSGYLEGLLNFIEQHESSKEDVMLEGTSYILQENAAKRLGFRSVPTQGIYSIILVVNYPTLIIAYSISKNKLSLPDLRKIKTYRSSVKELSNNKLYIKDLYEKLAKK